MLFLHLLGNNSSSSACVIWLGSGLFLVLVFEVDSGLGEPIIEVLGERVLIVIRTGIETEIIE